MLVRPLKGISDSKAEFFDIRDVDQPIIDLLLRTEDFRAQLDLMSIISFISEL